MPGFIGVPELLLLGILALVIFGPKRLPEMGRGLGKGMREFKESVTGSGHEFKESLTGRDPHSQAALDAEHLRQVEEMKEVA